MSAHQLGDRVVGAAHRPREIEREHAVLPVGDDELGRLRRREQREKERRELEVLGVVDERCRPVVDAMAICATRPA